MSDELDRLRRLRADGLLPDDPPDPNVLAAERHRLLADIAGATDEPAPTPTIYPRLAYRDEIAAVEFLTRAFGFVERREARMEHPDGTLAWLELGDGLVMIGRSGPQRHGLTSPIDADATTTMMMVYVDDVDTHYARAVTQGANVLYQPQDMFWGDRRYEALDHEGHRWHFAERRRGAGDPLQIDRPAP